MGRIGILHSHSDNLQQEDKQMGYMRFNYKSRELGKYVDISVVIPTERYAYDSELKVNDPTNRKHLLPFRKGMKFQTVYLIHGGGDDDTMVYRYTNAERFAREANVMLVTPNIANSFGIDTRYGVKYQTFLAEELPTVIQTLFPSSDKREDNFIMGFAMGGNVALGTAILHPEKYAECVDISGGIGMTLDNQTLKDELDGDHFRNAMPLFNAAFGPSSEVDGADYDLHAAAERNLKSGIITPIHIAVGSKEFIRKRVETDYARLCELNYPVTFELVEGADHDWVFWDNYIEKALKEVLSLKHTDL